MKNRFILVLFLMLIMMGIAVAAQDIFEHESWPYEGMPYFEMVTDKIELRESSSNKAPVVTTINVEKGSAISFDFGAKELVKRRKEYGEVFGIKNSAKINTDLVLGKSIQKTIKPGIIRATAAVTADGFKLKKSDVIEDLLYLGEGVCLYRFSGKVSENETCLYSQIENGSLVQESRPVTEWWVTLEKNGKTLGWLKIDDSSPLHMVETIK